MPTCSLLNGQYLKNSHNFKLQPIKMFTFSDLYVGYFEEISHERSPRTQGIFL